MLFTDILFLFYFFPLFISIYYLVRKNDLYSNIVIVFFSLIFYASFGTKNLPILIFPLILDYVLAIVIHKHKGSKKAKWLLAAAIIVNLSLLIYFKYANFFLETIDSSHFINPVIIPLGISFITFQRISYVVDVYRSQVKPTHNFVHYATYACLFPHLISGPIVRFSQIKHQLGHRQITPVKIFEGTKYLVFGFIFKIVVANQLFEVESLLIENLTTVHFIEALLLIVYFTFRIYFDFLGYSLIAIGLAKYIGFDFPDNFNAPYQATSIRDFWRRWNITLSTWLRDYLYIPLGGNRKGKHRTYVNLLITMLLGGLWHGANWNFLIWGGVHGAFLAAERFLQDSRVRLPHSKHLSQMSTLFIVSLAWIIFRFSSLNEVVLLFNALLHPTLQKPQEVIFTAFTISLPALAIAVIWSFLFQENFINKIKANTRNGIVFSTLLILLILYSLIRKEVPFIYFQF